MQQFSRILMSLLLLLGCNGTAPAESETDATSASSTNETDTGGSSHEVCDRYIACVAVSAPMDLPSAQSGFGSDSECWTKSQADMDLCIQACETGLAQSHMLFPDEEKCYVCQGTSECDAGAGEVCVEGGCALLPHPFQDEWREVVKTSFPLDVVESVKFGRTEYLSNFANRGDVEVYFDLPDESITIELRRYTFQTTPAEAQEDFDKTNLWAYAHAGAPKSPSDMDPSTACQGGWKDGCLVTIYYDGAVQPTYVGADLRVHLPAAFRETLQIETEDNASDPIYPLRGDVHVVDFCGSGDIKLASGHAEVQLCSGLTPAPTCSPEEISLCENWMIDGMSAPWDPGCPCSSFGALKIEAVDPEAGNITIDMPATVWAYVTLKNLMSGQAVDGYHCTATVEPTVCGPGCTVNQSAETPWNAVVDLNYPGLPATKGAGYGVAVVSNGCQQVTYAEGPADYIPGVQSPGKEEQRGNLRLCSGCL